MESSTTTTTTTTTARASASSARTRTTSIPWSPFLLVKRIAAYIGAILRLIRVRQWVKNLFLFIPSFFAGHLFKTDELLMVGIGAIAFSLVASGVYVINDYRDR